ncbi:uncharacterized protein EV420DRAFT_1692598 [Desarmillaria tabescens]|uniref:F-box domain-containing protein n=1 Tax=Armillaria tabescens TaxID=1929756 RepID=A0AA39N391_ARMTA|nr:uncharacterized protein EV420DRAFT_1692598 [Desarmillaria tabescens]KAK0455779.1 hypothetical protein EV420DRAFT_1692598 [Desarmillaria tabescens]
MLLRLSLLLTTSHRGLTNAYIYPGEYLWTDKAAFCICHRNNDQPSEYIETKAREELKAAQGILDIAEPEILLEIAICNVEDKSYGGYPGGPWLFARVCRKWKAVALSSKALWSTVILNNTFLSSLNLRKKAQVVLLEQLRRSGSMPLRIYLNFEDVSYSKSTMRILTDVVLQAFRWKSFEFHASVMFFHYMYLKVEHCLPILEQINLRITDTGTLSKNDGTYLMFSEAPHLCDVELDTNSSDPFDLPFPQLTRYINHFNRDKSHS